VSDRRPTTGDNDDGWTGVGKRVEARVRSPASSPDEPSSKATSLRVGPEVAAASCYLLVPVTGLVVLGSGEENPYVRFHAIQSLLYGGATISTWFGAFCTLALFPAMTPGPGASLLLPAGFLAGICMLGYGPYAADRSLRGEHHEIPYLWRFAAERSRRHR
jgi:uncharacterized membrane protein